jgi:hypothetical protein
MRGRHVSLLERVVNRDALAGADDVDWFARRWGHSAVVDVPRGPPRVGNTPFVEVRRLRGGE